MEMPRPSAPHGLPCQASRHWMLLPSLACQASCVYCFGPNRGPEMSPSLFDAALDWIAAITPANEPVNLTFHGGEPLLVGLKWYARHLPLLQERFGPRLRLHLQSNLWLLDDATCDLFRHYGVSLGTSLDGPKVLNDRQRGEGYFDRTMAGICLARRYRLPVGVICTFTNQSAPYYRDIFEFFASENLSFSIHAAVPGLKNDPGRDLALSPVAYAGLLTGLFDYYLDNITRLRISTLDTIAHSILAGNGSMCTLSDCLGQHLTVDPDGSIFSCNRFAYQPDRRLGSVLERPTLDDLARSPAWQRQRERELTVQADCGDCPHFDYCKGGCPYNAASGGIDRRDPHCEAYKQLFEHITRRALDEIFLESDGPENASEACPGDPLAGGTLLHIMRGGQHPQEAAQEARKMAASVALASTASPEDALHQLDRVGLITRPEVALENLRWLHEWLGSHCRADRNDGPCGSCALRYLCGAFCNAWTSFDDAGICPLLYDQAAIRLHSALKMLKVEPGRWLAAGLPYHNPISPKT